MRYLATVLLIALPGFVHAQSPANQHEGIGDVCAQANEPKACMESYGFRCHQGRRPGKSIEAMHLGCNLDLGDGRLHFVQMLYDNGGWAVERQKTYVPDRDEPRWPQEDPSLALSNHVREAMGEFSTHSSSSSGADGQPQELNTGARRVNGRIQVIAVCGAVTGPYPDDNLSESLRADCDRALMRTVQRVGQAAPGRPYVAPSSTAFSWDEQVVRIVSGDSALIVQGQYTFPEPHMPCLWTSDCCSTDGMMYLNSCRAPSEEELQIVQGCLAKGERIRSEGFTNCLRSSGVKVGCEQQADGTYLCY